MSTPVLLVQRAGLVEDGLGHAQLAEVVEDRSVLEVGLVDLAALMLGKRVVDEHRDCLHMAAVATQVAVAGVDDGREGLGDVHGRLFE